MAEQSTHTAYPPTSMPYGQALPRDRKNPRIRAARSGNGKRLQPAPVFRTIAAFKHLRTFHRIVVGSSTLATASRTAGNKPFIPV